jgi:hypothetical protein
MLHFPGLPGDPKIGVDSASWAAWLTDAATRLFLAIPVAEIIRIVVTDLLAQETGGEQARSVVPVTALYMNTCPLS